MQTHHHGQNLLETDLAAVVAVDGMEQTLSGFHVGGAKDATAGLKHLHPFRLVDITTAVVVESGEDSSKLHHLFDRVMRTEWIAAGCGAHAD